MGFLAETVEALGFYIPTDLSSCFILATGDVALWLKYLPSA